jgi:RNA polymerase sigma factor (sigma-70 family)
LRAHLCLDACFDLINTLEEIIDIWKLFVKGDDRAFRKLIFEHYAVLFNYGSRFTEDRDLVKDAIQDLFLSLWNKRTSLSQPENIKAYLFASLRRSILRKLSENRKAKEKVGDVNTHFDFQVSTEVQYIKEETTANIAKKMAFSIEKLPPRQKEVIFLKFYQGFDRNEIAQAMDITPQTVSNLLQIALNKLKGDFGHAFDPSILYLVVPLFFKDFFQNL